MNTFHSAGRPVRQSPQSRNRGRPAGKVASQSRHPTVPQSVRATLPSFPLNPSKRLCPPPRPPIKFPPRLGDHPRLAAAGRATTAAGAAIFSIAKWCITIEIYHTWSNFVLLHPSPFRSLRRPSSPSSSVSIWPPRCGRCATCRRSRSGRGGITIESRRARRRGGRRRGRRRWRARRRCRGPWGSCSRWSCR